MIRVLAALKTFLEIDTVAVTIGTIDAGLNVASLFDIVKNKFNKDSVEYLTACALDEALKESCEKLGWEYDALAVSQELDVGTLLTSTMMTKAGLGDLFTKFVGVELDGKALVTIIDCFDKSVAEKDKLHRYLDQKWKRNVEKPSPTTASISLTTIPVPVDLIGREDEIAAIRSLIAQENNVSIRADGGVGKTAAATRIANDVKGEIERGESAFKHTAWITSTGNLKEDLTGLDVPAVELAGSVDEKFSAACRFLQQNPTFLVIDNMDSLPSPRDLNTVNTVSGRTKFLITTRSSISGFKTYILKTLDKESAIRLFYKHYYVDSDMEGEDSRIIVGKVVTAASCNALLIELIAKMAYWEYTGRLKELWAVLEKDVLGMDSEIDIETEHAYSHLSEDDLKLQGQIRNLYRMSDLTETHQELMRFFALFPAEATIFADVFKWAGFAIGDLKYLTERGWIEKAGDGFLIHTMVKGSVGLQGSTFDAGKYENLIENLGDTDQYMPEDMVYTKVRERIVVPKTICRLLSGNGIETENTAKLHYNLAGVYCAQSDYGKALEFYWKALAISERVIGEKHPNTAKTYNNIGRVYEHRGEYGKALEYCQKALAIFEQALGKNHPDTAKAYNNIGRVYEDQGDYEKALEFFRKALAIFERVPGEDHPDTATTHSNIGDVYRAQDDYVKAMEHCQKALGIFERVLGKGHPDTATAFNKIGRVYESQRDHVKALEYYQKALAIFERVLGENHPDTAATYNNIGYVYEDQRDYGKALEYYQKALAIYERVPGEDHPDTATTFNNIGRVFFAQRNFMKALEYYRKDLLISERVLGEDHLDTATTYNNIGGVYFALGYYMKALKYYWKALAIFKRMLGEDHSYIATTYDNIGGVYHEQDNYVKALEYYQKALAIRKRVLGEDHPYTQDTGLSVTIMEILIHSGISEEQLIDFLNQQQN